MISEVEERPSLSVALAEYSERIFSGVPLREKYKHPLRCEFESHLEEYSEELLDLGYKPYAVEDEVIRRVGPPEQIAENFNRMESLRNWLRDHLATRAVACVALGYVAVSIGLEILNLLMGLSGLDTQMAYGIDRYLVYVREIFALLSGPLAFSLYYRWSGNTHRLTPFVTLSMVLFIAVNIIECNLNFISPFPNPECRIFLLLVDLPSPFSAIPFMARSMVVYEFGLSGFSVNLLERGLHIQTVGYSPDAPETLLVHYLGLALAVSFLLERFKQRQFFQPA